MFSRRYIDSRETNITMNSEIAKTATLSMFFGISGNLRFLSHRETFKMLERALVRCGLSICYSQGFNPRPKMSLPLPRTVGIASDSELMTVRVDDDNLDIEAFDKSIQAELPQGFEIKKLELLKGNCSYQPREVDYLFELTEDIDVGGVETAISKFAQAKKENEPINIIRKSNKKADKTVDISKLISRICLENHRVVVSCPVDNSGSARIDEISELLRIDHSMLKSPIKRVNVEWQKK